MMEWPHCRWSWDVSIETFTSIYESNCVWSIANKFQEYTRVRKFEDSVNFIYNSSKYIDENIDEKFFYKCLMSI